VSDSQRYRSRLFPKSIKGTLVLKNQAPGLGSPYSNRRVHASRHRPAAWVYSSKATLDTNAGTPFYPTRGARITGVRLQVAGAPSSTLTCDVLLNGVSIFPSSDKPTIASSALYGAIAMGDIVNVTPDDKLQVQLTATGSGTGPLVATIEYVEAY